jgi:hypothetical protein
MTNPTLFFRLHVEHTYFKSRKSMNLEFSPVGLTAMLISKFILYFLERSNGFELYIDMNRFNHFTDYLREEGAEWLGVIMTMKDRGFLNYTELDIPKGSFLLLKTSLPADTDTETIKLHHSDVVGASDLAELSSEAGANIPGEFHQKPTSFAFIQIPFRKKGDEIELTDRNGNLNALSGVIMFEARSTYWKFILIPREELQFDSMQVTDTNGEVTFTKMAAGKDVQGSAAFISESLERIPLREISDYQFQLSGLQNGTNHTIIQRLAEPHPEYLSKVNGKLYSTIFIYY